MNEILDEIKRLEIILSRTIGKDIKVVKKNIEINKPSATQLQIIRYITEHKGEDIFQKDLEAVLNLRRATVSGVLQTMEKNRLIVRKVCQDDTRTKKIYLTPKTEKMFLDISHKLDELQKVATSGISKSDLNIFLSVVDKMCENLEENFN